VHIRGPCIMHLWGIFFCVSQNYISLFRLLCMWSSCFLFGGYCRRISLPPAAISGQSNHISLISSFQFHSTIYPSYLIHWHQLLSFKMITIILHILVIMLLMNVDNHLVSFLHFAKVPKAVNALCARNKIEKNISISLMSLF